MNKYPYKSIFLYFLTFWDINRGTQGVQPAADEKFGVLKVQILISRGEKQKNVGILEGTKVDFPRCRVHLEV